jgi:plastocyanin
MMNPTPFSGRRSRRVGAALGVALCAIFAAPASFAADAASGATVDITKFAFTPKEITVAPGTTVRWTNHDEIPHTVTSQEKVKVFTSKAMDTDDKYEFTFAKEGDYAYVCTVHPFMTGVVHVRKP